MLTPFNISPPACPLDPTWKSGEKKLKIKRKKEIANVDSF